MNVSTSRPGNPTRLWVALLVFLLSIPVGANDNDPDWGLPGPVNNLGGGKSESATYTFAASGEFEAAVLPSTVGHTDVTLKGAESVDVSAADTGADPVIAAHPSGVRHEAVPGGQALQGSADVTLDEGMGAVLRAPESASVLLTFLMLDVGAQGLGALVASDGHGVHGVVPMGAVTSVDLVKLQSLVKTHAAALSGEVGQPVGVSVVMISVDPAGQVHVAGARVTTDGASIEVYAE